MNRPLPVGFGFGLLAVLHAGCVVVLAGACACSDRALAQADDAPPRPGPPAKEPEKDARFQAYRAECAIHALRINKALRAYHNYDALLLIQILREVPFPFQQTWETRYLRELGRRMSLPLRHDEPVYGVAVSADGKSALTRTTMGLKLWDAASGRVKRTFKPEKQSPPFHCAAISGNGQIVVAAMGNPGELGIWEATTGARIALLKGHSGPVFDVVLSGDGKRILSLARQNQQGEIKLWDSSTGQPKLALSGDWTAASISADGRSFVTASVGTLGKATEKGPEFGAGARSATELKIWETETGHLKQTIQGQGLLAVAISGDGKRVVSTRAGNNQPEVQVWDVATGREISSFKGEPDEFRSVALSADGNTLVSMVTQYDHGLPGKVTVWDLKAGRQTAGLSGHTAAVHCVAVSADGQCIVSGGEDETARRWHLKESPERLALRGHKAEVLGVALSDDGQRIVSGSADHTAKVWDGRSGREKLSFQQHSDEVRSVALSGDGRRVFSGGGPLQGDIHGELKVWDALTGKLTLEATAELPVFGVAASADGRTIVVGGGTRGGGELPMFGELTVWDGTSGKQRFSLGTRLRSPDTGQEFTHITAVTGVALSADGRLAASADVQGSVRLWDARTGKERSSLRERRASGKVQCVALGAAGKLLLAGSGGNINVWDAETAKKKLTLRGHTGDVSAVCVSADGRRIISGSADKTVKLWDADTGQEMLTLEGHADAVTSVAISADGQRIVSGSRDRTVKVWEAPASKELLAIDVERQDLGRLSVEVLLAITADGKKVMARSRSVGSESLDVVGAWDAQSGRERLTVWSPDRAGVSTDLRTIVTAGGEGSNPGELTVWDADAGKQKLAIKAHAGLVFGLAVSGDGSRIVSVGGKSRPEELKSWEAATGRLQATIHGDFDPVAVSPDGALIVTRGPDWIEKPQLKVWTADAGKELFILKGQSDVVAFAADGKRMVTSGVGADGSPNLRVCSAVTGEELFTVAGVVRAAVSADGKRMVAQRFKRGITIFDAESGRELVSLKGQTDDATCVAISADGKHAVSGYADSTVRVWDAKTGEERFTGEGRGGPITGVAISASGQRVFSGSGDGMVRIWQGLSQPDR